MGYFVYILECGDGTYYTGTTNNLEKRVEAHNSASAGAKYTRARRPVSLVYSEECIDKSEALKREYALRQHSRAEKASIIAKFQENRV